MIDLDGKNFPWIQLEKDIREELLPKLTGDDVNTLNVAIKEFSSYSLRVLHYKY